MPKRVAASQPRALRGRSQAYTRGMLRTHLGRILFEKELKVGCALSTRIEPTEAGTERTSDPGERAVKKAKMGDAHAKR